MPEHDETRPPEPGAEPYRDEEARRTPATQQLGRVVVVALVVLFVVFALANAQFVDFSWIFSGTEVVESGGERISGGVPLILLLAIAFVLGTAFGWLLTVRRRRRRADVQRREG